jgi:hypothetical protein
MLSGDRPRGKQVKFISFRIRIRSQLSSGWFQSERGGGSDPLAGRSSRRHPVYAATSKGLTTPRPFAPVATCR